MTNIYPTECAKVRKKNTFSVDAKLFPAKVEDGQNPLEVYDARFSRFIFSIIETGKESVSVNVPIRDVPGIIDATATARLAGKLSAPKVKSEQTSPAYTVRISSGRVKGRTPADVLLNEADGEEILNSQYAFLKKNQEKYPGNRAQMDAIVDAANLKKAGKLSKDGASGDACGMKLYSVGIKSLQNRRKPNGKCFTYSLDISWEYGEPCPVVIRAENYYAYMDDSGGMIRVNVQSKEDFKTQTFRMTAAEWSDVLYRMQMNMRIFENKYGNECLQASAKAETDARLKAGIPLRA